MKSPFEIKKEIGEVGHKLWAKGFVAANDGNISVKISENEYYCTPTGVSSDCRDICSEAEKGNYRAKLALKILVHNIKKIVGSYVAEMNGVDALVFTAGIGENDRQIREDVCKNMSFLGIEIDEAFNQSCARGEFADISAKGAKVKTFVIPTNEEYMIALDTQNLTK